MTISPHVDIAALTISFRRLVLWFGAQLLLEVGSRGLHVFPGSSIVGATLGVALTGGLIATIVALAYYGFRTASALGSRVAWLWAVAMFVPCANVIFLLALHSNATQACAARGVPVGLFGPKVVVRDGTTETTGEKAG